ncbi:Pentatricopeptide repeat superfamily protein [Perilla frutescens var. hirtella]|uniref:Pentatricopeptide repeat superfamily protein n=1 Tax=Perilla frutescens var. hirtella TaxID=608512 RepID=A0AAD4P7K3_PERFH|nr:Pentatricopeptide repeat superfamily protein [Perilla frutescens var. hirtella]
MPSEMKNLISWNTMISGYLKLENEFESAKDSFDNNNMTTDSTETLATCLKRCRKWISGEMNEELTGYLRH